MPKKIRTFDTALILIPVIFLAVSISVIWSLVLGTNNDGLGLKQGIIALVGIAIGMAFSFVDYRLFKNISWFLYGISVLLLIFVDISGKTVNGAMNWMNVGFFQLQPSEVAKIGIIMTLGTFFATKIGKITVKDIALSFLILLLPLFLVLKEPDLGTGIIMVLIYVVMLFWAKPTIKQQIVFFTIILAFLSVAGLAYKSVRPFDGLLHDYQRNRVKVFLDPGSAPLKEGYNVKQAQITIGSGGLLGRGLGKGTQSQLQFLPEPQTDFIFAGIAESFGFLGSFVVLLLYAIFILRVIEIAALSRDNFGMMIALGVASMFFFHVLINVGMALGLMPVTGIPLPLLSYGGTSLVISLFSIGVVQSIFTRHKKITF